MNRNTAVGHLACAVTYIIFGINIVACRDIAAEGNISPVVLFTMRSLVAGLLFWVTSLFTKSEPVPPKDLLKIAGAGLLGIFLPQMTFLYAITMTTPVDLSVIGTITPILTMFAAAIFLKEPITWQKSTGVAVSFGGIIWLILQSVSSANGVNATHPMGVVLCIANSATFALYLATCRPLTAKYSPVTMMKWMFLVAFILSLPLSIPKLPATDFGAVSARVWMEIGFLILFATFVAYFLIPAGQRRIRPTLVSMYGYLQPIIATVAAIATGMDRLTVTKVAAAILVFVGVYIVNQSRAAVWKTGDN